MLGTHEVRHSARTGWRRRRRPSVLVLAVAQMRRFFAEGRVSFARGRAGLYRRGLARRLRGIPPRGTGGKTHIFQSLREFRPHVRSNRKTSKRKRTFGKIATRNVRSNRKTSNAERTSHGGRNAQKRSNAKRTLRDGGSENSKRVLQEADETRQDAAMPKLRFPRLTDLLKFRRSSSVLYLMESVTVAFFRFVFLC